MYKAIFAAVVAAGLMAALLPQSAAAQDKPATAQTKKPPTPAQIALRARQKKCGEEWKAAKAAGTIEKGMKWPQYWSACNKRLKAAGS